MKNKAEKKEAIEILQKWIDGEDMEVYDLSVDKYRDVCEEDLLTAARRLRIKPKPLDLIGVVNNRDRDFTQCDSKEECLEFVEKWDTDYPHSAPHRVVHMREITK